MPESLIEAAIGRLLEVGDLEYQTSKSRKAKGVAWRHDATTSPPSGDAPPKKALEGKRREPPPLKGNEENEGNRAHAFSATDHGDTVSKGSGKLVSNDASLGGGGTPQPTAQLYASPCDELKAIFTEKTGQTITLVVLDTIRANLGGDITQEFVDHVRSNPGSFKNLAGYLRKESKNFRRNARSAASPLTAAQAADLAYQCRICFSRDRRGGVLPGDPPIPCSSATPEYIAELRAREIRSLDRGELRPPARPPRSAIVASADRNGLERAGDVSPPERMAAVKA